MVFVDSLRWCDVAIVVRRYRLCEMDYRVLTLSRNSMNELLSMQAEGCYELRVYLRCAGQSETQRRERECDASYRGARTFQLSSHLTPVIVMPACPRVSFRAKFRARACQSFRFTRIGDRKGSARRQQDCSPEEKGGGGAAFHPSLPWRRLDRNVVDTTTDSKVRASSEAQIGRRSSTRTTKFARRGVLSLHSTRLELNPL